MVTIAARSGLNEVLPRPVGGIAPGLEQFSPSAQPPMQQLADAPTFAEDVLALARTEPVRMPPARRRFLGPRLAHHRRALWPSSARAPGAGIASGPGNWHT
jgi:hypothetical protein